MLFCQLAHADSLREICNGLGCCLGKLVHLGITKAPNKSTLSYANEHRPAKLYEDLFYTALQRFRNEGGLGPRKKKFRFKNKLLSLDSTTISLCLELFPWAQFRRAKGGVKAHVLLDHDDYLPRYVLITEAKCSDVKMADAFPLHHRRDGELPNIYLISPFKAVKSEITKRIMSMIWVDKNRGIDPPRKHELQKWCRERVGTVHTFQGKEEDSVVMVLGADAEHAGCAYWACAKPNIVNVALTRARRRFYVVGDRTV